MQSIYINDTVQIYADDNYVYKLFNTEHPDVSMTCGYLYEQKVYSLLQTHFPDDERFVKATNLSIDEVKAIDSNYNNGIKIKKFDNSINAMMQTITKEQISKYLSDLRECCDKMKSIKLMHNDLHDNNIYFENDSIRIVDWDCSYCESLGFNPRLIGIRPRERAFLNVYVENVDFRMASRCFKIQTERIVFFKIDQKLRIELETYKTFHNFSSEFYIPKNFNGCDKFKDTCGLYSVGDIIIMQHITYDFENCTFTTSCKESKFSFDIEDYNQNYNVSLKSFSETVKNDVKDFLKKYINKFEGSFYKIVYLFLKIIKHYNLQNKIEFKPILFCCSCIIQNNDLTLYCPDTYKNATDFILKVFRAIKIENIAFPNAYIVKYQSEYNYDVEQINTRAKDIFINEIIDNDNINAYDIFIKTLQLTTTPIKNEI